MNTFGEFEAIIIREFDDWQRNTVRLGLRWKEGRSFSYLTKDGNWLKDDDGAASSSYDLGLVLPVNSLEAIVQGIEGFQGRSSHATTEASVLREWLAVERGRVDTTLARQDAAEALRSR